MKNFRELIQSKIDELESQRKVIRKEFNGDAALAMIERIDKRINYFTKLMNNKHILENRDVRIDTKNKTIRGVFIRFAGNQVLIKSGNDIKYLSVNKIIDIIL